MNGLSSIIVLFCCVFAWFKRNIIKSMPNFEHHALSELNTWILNHRKSPLNTAEYWQLWKQLLFKKELATLRLTQIYIKQFKDNDGRKLFYKYYLLSNTHKNNFVSMRPSSMVSQTIILAYGRFTQLSWKHFLWFSPFFPEIKHLQVNYITSSFTVSEDSCHGQ